jgi:hypothetical protein
VLLKTCVCGETMDIELSTVIYSSKVEIEKVPIYSCKQCLHTEVLTDVKPELSRLIIELGQHPEKQKFYFDEMNEWAKLLALATDQELLDVPLEEIIGSRIDHLLDLMIIARSVGDEAWENELRGRLQQLTKAVQMKQI